MSMNIEQITQPHDKFIKACLADIEVAQDAIKFCISAEFAQQIDWQTFGPANSNLIKGLAKQLYADLLFQFKLKDEKEFNFCLLEHQSTPDKFLPFRIANYDIYIMDMHLKQIKQDKYLPDITNLCVYASKITPYPYSLDICDCFKNPTRAREKFKMFNNIILQDLTIIPEEELLKCGKADLVYILLKEGIKRDFLPLIEKRSKTFSRLFDRSYAQTGIVYIFEVEEVTPHEILLEAIIRVAPNQKDVIMSAAEQLKLEERKEIAKNMLQEDCQISLIQKVTGIDQHTIEEIKKRIELSCRK